MDKFISHTGSGLPLRRSNVDTDQIIPAVYLKRVTKSGFEDGLFAAWRNDPEFVLNKPQYKDATVLIAGVDFGTGSSREHAVWALQNYGFKVVISSRFARSSRLYLHFDRSPRLCSPLAQAYQRELRHPCL